MAKTHRVIRYIPERDHLVCFFCGNVVGDTEVHKQLHLVRDLVEIEVQDEVVRALTNPNHDYPDRWQQAEIDRRRREAEEIAYQARAAREREEAKAAADADVVRLAELLEEAKARREELHREPAV